MRTKIGSILLLGCTAWACNQVAPTAPDVPVLAGGAAHQVSPMAADTVTKPWKGRFGGTESPPSSPTPAGCLRYFDTTQNGTASHLGAFHGTGSTCATAANAPVDTPPFWDHEPAPPYFVAEFTADNVWTGADASQLWIHAIDGVFVQSQTTGATSVRGTLTIVGGTGRFEGASGSAAAAGGRNPGEAGDQVEFDGHITVCGPAGC